MERLKRTKRLERGRPEREAHACQHVAFSKKRELGKGNKIRQVSLNNN